MIRRKTVCTFICAALLLAGCEAESFVEQDSSIAAPSAVEDVSLGDAAEFTLEPLTFESDLEEAIYSFDWKDMSAAEDLQGFGYFGTHFYHILFADLDFDGVPEVLLYTTGERLEDGTPARTMIFALEGNRLVHRATAELSPEGRYYGPDSWREGFKRYYETDAGERVLIEYVFDRLDNRTSGYFLHEISLDGYATTPVLYSYAGYGLEYRYRYDRDRRDYTLGAVNEVRGASLEELIEGMEAQGFMPIDEEEYERLEQAYFESLTPAGYIRFENSISYSVRLGEMTEIKDYDTRGFALDIPPLADEIQRGEIINRTIAGKVCEDYLAFALELENPIQPEEREPWRAPEYDDPMQAMFCAFPWLDVEENPLASTRGNIQLWFADIDLDGETEIVLDMGECWVVYGLGAEGLMHKGDFVPRLSFDPPISEYYLNEQGDAVVPMEFTYYIGYILLEGEANVKGAQAVTPRYYAELSLRDLTVKVYLVGFIGGDGGPAPTYYASLDPGGTALIASLDDIEALKGYGNMESHGFVAVSEEEYTQTLALRGEGYSGPYTLKASEDVLSYAARSPLYTDGWATYHFNDEFLPFPDELCKATAEEVEAYYNDLIGRHVYEAWIEYESQS